MTVCSRSKT